MGSNENTRLIFLFLFFFLLISGQLGDVKLEDLPGPEALLRPGMKIQCMAQ